MKSCSLMASLIIGMVVLPSVAPAQVQLLVHEYFPADGEFRELVAAAEDLVVEKDDGRESPAEFALYREAGLERYHRRIYRLEGTGSLTIEIITLHDSRAAFSLLTILGPPGMAGGPPGDRFAGDDRQMAFCQANTFVRIASDIPGDLCQRVARSVSNRLGVRADIPALVRHLPGDGQDSNSIRYCLGPLAASRFAAPMPLAELKFDEGVEVAQAAYSVQGQNGTLSLIGFPIGQMADSHFESLSDASRSEPEEGTRRYLRRVGPIVGILSGNFRPETARQILESLSFTYSIKWIYDKENERSRGFFSSGGGLMGTVVRSLLFTAFLCGISICAGVLLGITRILIRGLSPNNFLNRSERTEIIRLKINEK